MDYIILDLGKEVVGDCQLQDNVGKIQCLSYSHGVSQPLTFDVSNNKRTSGKPQHQDFVLTKLFDKASPVLNYNCCIGKNHPTAIITIFQMDEATQTPKKYIEYTLTNAIISSVSVGGGGGVPTETLTLNYSKIKWWYMAQEDESVQKGNLAYEYDLMLAKGASSS
ncbi:Hcp family type VI secretion system effector [Insolitispirillum peregrinum]|uniref:Hcp family type VI secretion system effector n=1 Tax=Insolitispirillum peregrinum TaxID=80876 RepID=UPI00360A05F8